MNEQLRVQNLLRTKLTEIQEKNPGYSMRAFASKLELHPGALSHILNGNRFVSRKLVERIADKLMLDPYERAEILSMFPPKRTTKKIGKAQPQDIEPSKYLKLNAHQFKVAAEYEHFAILALMKCKDFQHDTEWIAARLRLSVPRTEQVIQNMIELEILEKKENGELKRNAPKYRTTDDVACVSMKKHHDETLDLAKTSLHRDSVLERDFTTMTMAVDKSKLNKAKEIIRKFQDELADLLETDNQTEVYRLSMQLFPLSKLASGDN